MTSTWNPSDKSSHITLSGGNLVTTWDGSAGGVRSTDSKSSGKYYFEVQLNVTDAASYVGLVNASYALTTPANNSNEILGQIAGAFIIGNSSNLGGTSGSISDGGFALIAVDLTNQLFWYSANGSPWNNSGTANPATGVGGISISYLTGPLFAYVGAGSGSSGEQLTANFGGSAFAFSVPSGFSAWGAVTSPAAGEADGAASVSGVGVAAVQASGESDGVSSVSGAASSLAAGAGAAAGVASVSGAGVTAIQASGNAAGSASVAGFSSLTISATGAADGSSSVSAAGVAARQASGASDGVSSVSGTAPPVGSGAGAAAGLAAVSGVGAAIFKAAGEADGAASVSGAGRAALRASGNAAGSSSVAGAASSIAAAAGAANGAAYVSGFFPPIGGPFFFHYVADATVPFLGDVCTVDEVIFSFELKHDEGQIPVLELEIKNPEVGLLSSGRKQWAWLSWWNGSSVVPLFFGRLVGIPSDLFAQVIKIQFIARAPDYISRKQALAETLKIAPYYDPVFLDDSRRDDPDAILEAWSAMYHTDRTSLAWTVSDILTGEDGTATFDGSTAFYDDLQLRIGQPPFTAVRVEMVAKWAQTATGGTINLPPMNLLTVTGEKLISDWPKAGASLGGGWYVHDAGVYDSAGIDAGSVSSSTNWRNAEETHSEGDTMSLTQTYSRPVFVGLQAPPPGGQETSRIETNGVGHSSLEISWDITPQYNIHCYMNLEYQANRKREERAAFTLTSNLQPVLTDETVQQDSELIQLNTVSLSDPLITPTNWTVLAGQFVQVGQVCFPNNPSLPAQSAFYICIVAGTCGATEPVFSDIVGATTADNSVIWACLGTSLPAIGDWQAATDASLGVIIAPSTPVWVPYWALNNSNFGVISAGAQVSVGTVIRANDGSSYQICIVAGTTASLYYSYQYAGEPPFSPGYGVITVDGSVEWMSLGPYLPAGIFQLCVQAGTTSAAIPPVPPPWSAVPGTVVTDGTVKWYALGANPPSISIPAGGQVNNVTARSYITTDRGTRSLEYGLMVARAHLRKKARCIEISFSAPFSSGVGLSCRMNAVIEDPRIPHGSATGKIISYALSCDGDSGEALTKVAIGCAVGTGGTALAVAPSDVYIADGYIADGYSETVGSTVLTGASDLGYAPPLDAPNDDGLVFPLTLDEVLLDYTILGDVDGLYIDLQLKNLTGSSFTTAYEIATTPLQIPQQINLS